MFDTDPKRPLARILAALSGLAIFGWGFGAIVWQGDLHYKNWYGELVFAPFAILVGLVIILSAVFRPEILGRIPKRLKR